MDGIPAEGPREKGDQMNVYSLMAAGGEGGEGGLGKDSSLQFPKGK